MPSVEISDEELKSLTVAIMNRHGLDFTCYEPKSLKRRVARTLTVFKLTSIHDLWTKLLKDASFIHPFVNEISVGLTSMFRDPKLWIRLREEVVNWKDREGKIKTWHSGCSTGEEIYSFNILLEEAGIRDKFDSLATDMSTSFLEKAQEGSYHIMKLEDYQGTYEKFNPSGNFEDYFTRKEKSFEMDARLISNVNFKQNNLITEVLDEKFDIIFCRNVMIYFDSKAKMKVLDKFYDNLKEGGLLIIGYFDSLVPVIDKSKYEFLDLNHKIFRKISKT